MPNEGREDKLRGIHRNVPQRRSSNRENWVNTPLVNALVEGMRRRDWTISDLGRAIGSAPSLVSRWMQGATPSTHKTSDLARALGIDLIHLMVLAGHLPASEDRVVDERTAMIMNKLEEIEMTDERFVMLNALVESMRLTPASGAATLPRQTPAPRTRHQDKESA